MLVQAATDAVKTMAVSSDAIERLLRYRSNAYLN